MSCECVLGESISVVSVPWYRMQLNHVTVHHIYPFYGLTLEYRLQEQLLAIVEEEIKQQHHK